MGMQLKDHTLLERGGGNDEYLPTSIKCIAKDIFFIPRMHDVAYGPLVCFSNIHIVIYHVKKSRRTFVEKNSYRCALLRSKISILLYTPVSQNSKPFFNIKSQKSFKLRAMLYLSMCVFLHKSRSQFSTHSSEGIVKRNF